MSGELPNAPPAAFQAGRALLAFVPPATLVTALLYYFGWARAYAQARALGADPSVFGYTTQDYLLRSVDSLYFPLIILAGLGLVALLLHLRISQRLGEAARARGGAGGGDPVLRRVGVALLAVGVAVLGFGLLYSADLLGRSRFLDLAGPLALGVGTLLAAYGGWLRGRAGGAADAGPFGQVPAAAWAKPVAAGFLLSVTALSLFWAVGNYALYRGQDLAIRVADGYRARPGVVVYSTDSLALEGVSQTRLDGVEGRDYTYRYSDMRLLDRVAGTYFLLPDDWDRAPRLILIKDAGGVRIELTAS
ncbi:MAG: hypothetical protein WCF04_02625 [Candidatus Nanopelagicales bacterium]